MSNLIHLIYNSAAVGDFTDHDLQVLLGKARDKNASLDITGMLLYVDGCFFQTLEGPEDAVDALAATIQKDPRHTRMTTIIREPIAKRAFSEWTMGFTHMSAGDVAEIDGLNDFFGSGRVLTDIDSGRAKKLLLAFKQGRWRVRLSTAAAAAALNAAEGSSEKMALSPTADPRPSFSFAFQPIVDANKRRVVAYEALVRGEEQQPATEILQRIPLGEIAAFDEDGRRMAIALASRLGMNGNLHLNVALLGQAAQATQTIDSTLETARRCGVDASRIVLELKHEATINDPIALGAQLKEFRQQGLRLSIDDFGSGHAGLALLDHYQPDTISLSMWLVRGIEGHGPRQAILRGLIQTCNDLGIDIIAKGVETPEEYFWLREEGIELFQGYLFARPGFESLPRPMLPADVL